MRKPSRVAGLQAGGGLAKEEELPEDSKWTSLADGSHSWTISWSSEFGVIKRKSRIASRALEFQLYLFSPIAHEDSLTPERRIELPPDFVSSLGCRTRTPFLAQPGRPSLITQRNHRIHRR